MRLRSKAIIVGFNYRFYLASLSYSGSDCFGQNVYRSLSKDPFRVELSQASYEKSISYDERTSAFLSELEISISPPQCLHG
jgi:hypothetical protein